MIGGAIVLDRLATIMIRVQRLENALTDLAPGASATGHAVVNKAILGIKLLLAYAQAASGKSGTIAQGQLAL